MPKESDSFLAPRSKDTDTDNYGLSTVKVDRPSWKASK